MVPDGVWLGENWGKANMGATWADEQAGILAREQAMGRKFDFIHTQYDRSGWNPPSVDKLGWIHAHGSAAVVSWSPPYSITGVNLGAADGMLAQAARHFENYPFPVMLRLWWEFDNTAGFPWACGYTADIGANFIKAWQRAVNLMHPLAPNLGFWWCPCEGSDRAGVNKSYPGDTYVDWVGSDIYNKGDRDLSQYSTPLHAGWATFEECAMYGPQSQYALWSGRKPFVVGELGCRDDTRKADWFRQIPGALAKAPNLAGLSMFDQDITALEGDNWMVDFGPGDPLAGFVDMAKALA